MIRHTPRGKFFDILLCVLEFFNKALGSMFLNYYIYIQLKQLKMKDKKQYITHVDKHRGISQYSPEEQLAMKKAKVKTSDKKKKPHPIRVSHVEKNK